MAERCKELDKFCYVCGHIAPRIQQHERKNRMTEEFKLAYVNFFRQCNVQDLTDEPYTPNTVCETCYAALLGWLHNRPYKKLPFQKPVIWEKDEEGHMEDRCYTCKNYATLSRKNLKSKIYYSYPTASIPELLAPGTRTTETSESKYFIRTNKCFCR